MALTLGTHAGFVLIAPTEVPTGIIQQVNSYNSGVRDTTPSGSIHITEIGFYNTNANDVANFEVGIYAADTGSPGGTASLLEVSRTNIKTSGSGWKRATVDWTINGDTLYWINIFVSNTTGGSTASRVAASGGGGNVVKVSQTTLANPYPASPNVYEAVGIEAIYALIEVIPPPIPGAGISNSLLFGEDF